MHICRYEYTHIYIHTNVCSKQCEIEREKFRDTRVRDGGRKREALCVYVLVM